MAFGEWLLIRGLYPFTTDHWRLLTMCGTKVSGGGMSVNQSEERREPSLSVDTESKGKHN